MTRYPIKIGFIIYGQEPYCNESNSPINQINDFVTFMTTYSLFDITPTIVYDTSLSISEIQYWGDWYPDLQCYYLYSNTIKNNNTRLNKIPTDVITNILMWPSQNLNVCWGGGTWGLNDGFNNTPLISISTNISGWCNSNANGRWTAGTEIITHEFLHALDIIIFNKYNLDHIQNSDKCSELGYKDPNTYYDCYIEILSQITTQMYEVIVSIPECSPNWTIGKWSECNINNNQTRTVTDINGCNSNIGKPIETQSCTYIPPLPYEEGISPILMIGLLISITINILKKR